MRLNGYQPTDELSSTPPGKHVQPKEEDNKTPNIKVFCSDCKHAIYPYLPNPDWISPHCNNNKTIVENFETRYIKHGDCKKLNAKNNCTYFKPKLRIRLFLFLKRIFG